jgi:hypothetical protein
MDTSGIRALDQLQVVRKRVIGFERRPSVTLCVAAGITHIENDSEDVQVGAHLDRRLRLRHPLGAQVVLLGARGDDGGAIEEEQRDVTRA